MSHKRERVDPATQTSMLAPSPAALALGLVVEREGVYYQAPKSEPVSLTSEQAPLQGENRALHFLDLANTTRRNIANMAAYQANLKSGKVKSGANVETELRRLGGEPDKSSGPKGAIGSAEEQYRHYRHQAQRSFADSIGIATVIEEVERPVEGTLQAVEVVFAEDPAQQVELTRRYKAFYDQYGQPGDQATEARAARQQEIAGQFELRTAA